MAVKVLNWQQQLWLYINITIGTSKTSLMVRHHKCPHKKLHTIDWETTQTWRYFECNYGIVLLIKKRRPCVDYDNVLDLYTILEEPDPSSGQLAHPVSLIHARTVRGVLG